MWLLNAERYYCITLLYYRAALNIHLHVFIIFFIHPYKRPVLKTFTVHVLSNVVPPTYLDL